MIGTCGFGVRIQQKLLQLQTHLKQRTGCKSTNKQEYNLLSPNEVKSLSTRGTPNRKESPYRLEWSSKMIISPNESTINAHAPQICSRYLPVIVTICPETVPTRAAPSVYGI